MTTLPPTGKCRACDAPIAWRRTVNGKGMPLDPEADPNGIVIVDGDHCHVLHKDDDPEAFPVKHTSHFATCSARLKDPG
jgi:hypothetical protein